MVCWLEGGAGFFNKGKQGDCRPTALAQAFLQRMTIPTNVYASALDMQRLNYYAVEKTIEFRLLTVFQHVADPARVCTVADKNTVVIRRPRRRVGVVR